MHPRSSAPLTAARTALPALALLSAVTLAFPSRAAAAQDPGAGSEATGEIRGTVHDSIAGEPLEGATVLVLGTGLSATTAADGSFVLEQVPAGSHRISFFHERLDAVGLGPATWNVDVEPGTTGRVTLWIPSAGAIARALCRSTPGVLVGTLREEEGGPPTGGSVVVRWESEGRVRSDRVMTDERGRYAVCGLPTGRALRVSAARGGRTGATHELRLPRSGLLVRDVALDLDAPATLQGTVLTEDGGTPIPDVTVRIGGASAAVHTDNAGRFHIADVPPGRRVLELEHVAFGSRRDTLDLPPGSSVQRTFEVPTEAVELEGLEVTAERRYRGRLAGFEDRMQQGRGEFLTREQIAEREDQPMARIIASRSNSINLQCQDHPGRTPRGMVVGSVGRCWLATRRPMRSLESAMESANPCRMEYWVDGAHLGGDFDITGIDPRDVEAVEIYPGPATIPARFKTSNSHCGVTVIWTREPGSGGR